MNASQYFTIKSFIIGRTVMIELKRNIHIKSLFIVSTSFFLSTLIFILNYLLCISTKSMQCMLNFTKLWSSSRLKSQFSSWPWHVLFLIKLRKSVNVNSF